MSASRKANGSDRKTIKSEADDDVKYLLPGSARNQRPDDEDQAQTEVFHDVESRQRHQTSASQTSQQNTSLPRRRTVASVDSERTGSPSPYYNGDGNLPPPIQPSSFQGLNTATRGNEEIPRARFSQNANPAEALHLLGRQIAELREERERHLQNGRRLEDQIEDGEILCGRLLQQYLEVARAIATKKKHIAEDKEQLSKVRRLEAGADEKINYILTQISALVLDKENAQSSGMAHTE